MQRILPTRSYAETDVINLFARTAINSAITDSGSGDAGLFVKISSADLNKDPIAYSSAAYLGKTDYPHIFGDMYPAVPHKVVPATAGAKCLGITLKQVAAYDENGEKLLYRKDRLESLNAVLSGQAEPILKRGIVTLASSAFDGTLTPGQKIAISANAGKVTGVADGVVQASGNTIVGEVLGTGSRSSNAGITDPLAGNYALVFIDC